MKIDGVTAHTRFATIALLVGILQLGSGFPTSGQQTTVRGLQTNFLTLSAGAPPPLTNLNIALSNAGPGSNSSGIPAAPPPGSNFIAQGNFGDLSQVTNGQPAQAILGLRIRGDVDYQVLMTQAYYSASNLQFRGADISGNTDRGSFIRVFVGTPVPVGSFANVRGSNLNPALAGTGLLLSQVAFGTNSPGYGTLVISGTSPTVPPEDTSTPPGMGGLMPMPTLKSATSTTGGTTGGTTSGTANGATAGSTTSTTTGMTVASVMNSTLSNNGQSVKFADSAIDVPLIFSLPTGLELGPVVGPAPGTFNTQLQFSIFPRS